MKDTDRQNSPSTQGPQEKQNIFDEAKTLFDQMAGEAIRRSELERKEAQSRGPITRFFMTLTIILALIGATTMFYGAYNFPDAPIRQTERGYVGKGGKPHTQEDFEIFLLWKKSLFILFSLTFTSGFIFAIGDRKQRRRNNL